MEKTLCVIPEVVWVENLYSSSVASAKTNPLRKNSLSNLVEDHEDEDEEEEEGHDLPQDGEWTLLPDGTKQIYNLYKVSS